MEDNLRRVLDAADAEAARVREMFGREAEEPRASSAERPPVGYHNRNAGLGVLVARRMPKDAPERASFYEWKQDPTGHPFLATMIVDLVRMLREWQQNAIPREWLVTTPPPGVSDPRCHPSEILAEAVGACFGLAFRPMLRRAERKVRLTHHPRAALDDADSGNTIETAEDLPAGSTVLVIDDFVSSGATMAASLAAIRGAGAVAHGVAWASK